MILILSRSLLNIFCIWQDVCSCHYLYLIIQTHSLKHLGVYLPGEFLNVWRINWCQACRPSFHFSIILLFSLEEFKNRNKNIPPPSDFVMKQSSLQNSNLPRKMIWLRKRNQTSFLSAQSLDLKQPPNPVPGLQNRRCITGSLVSQFISLF